MPGRSLWTGTISFGLVSIPVRLFSAVSAKEVHFHMLHKSDGGRVHQKLFCEKDGKEVSRKDIVKGYELKKGKYVEVDLDELAKLTPEATHSIDITDFVKQEEIDPIYYERTYHVLPDKAGAKAYGLLHEAMKQSERVGIATLVMRAKSYLCAMRPGDKGLMLTTMQYSDEIVAASSYGSAKVAKPSAKELAMANQLIDTLSGPFDAKKYKDDYRESVLDLIRKKAKGKVLEAPEPEAEDTEDITDLAEALRRSLEPKSKSKPAAKKKAARKPLRRQTTKRAPKPKHRAA